MIYLKKFDTHASYEADFNGNGGGVDFKIPNVSYCKDIKDIHYLPYNLVRFYVEEITTPQTLKIYTDETASVEVTVSEGYKWYTYVLPKDKELFRIEGNSVKEVVVKADISFIGASLFPSLKTIIPSSTIKASFKGSNTSNVTNMGSMFNLCSGLTSLDLSSFDTSNVTSMNYMFNECRGLTSLDLSNFNTSNVTSMATMFYNCKSLTSLDLSGWDTSKVTSMNGMFSGCNALKGIFMVGCTENTITSIGTQLANDGITGVHIFQSQS